MKFARKDDVEAEVLFEQPDYRIRLAGNRGAVGQLLKRMYGSRGYKSDALAQTAHAAQNQITLEAVADERTVGTISVGFDSPDHLQAEFLYREEIAAFRDQGARVCEFTKLAVDSEFNSGKVLPQLFHLAHIYAHLIGRATDLFVEVNPRHAVFYRRMLGFSRIGAEKTCPRVNAPAVLLHLDLHYAAKQISIYGGGQKSLSRSFYPDLFSPREEETLRRRIEGGAVPPAFSVVPARAAAHHRGAVLH
jgi:hypothetical protein